MRKNKECRRREEKYSARGHLGKEKKYVGQVNGERVLHGLFYYDY